MSSKIDSENSAGENSGERAVSPSALRRAENLQIVVAIGILTVAGTLYVNDLIKFPLLESAASITYVRQIFRYFIYTTILFIIIKVVTITIYPFSSNRYLYWIHDIVTPFLYTFSPILLILATVIGVTIGEVNSPGLVIAVLTILSTAISAVRTYSLFGEKKETHAKMALDFGVTKIMSELINQSPTEDDPTKRSELSDLYSLRLGDNREISIKTEEILSHLESDPTAPVEFDNDTIWISDQEAAKEYMKNHDNLVISPSIEYQANSKTASE